MPSWNRSAFFDPLRDSNFYLYDVAPIDTLALPIFTPLFGFQTCSSPEITVETEEIKEANNPYPTHVVTGASVGTISMTRGVSTVDADFWRWITTAISGNTGGGIGQVEVGGFTYRRTLLLLHLFRNLPLPFDGGQTNRGYEAAALAVSGAVISTVAGFATKSVAAGVTSALQLAALGTYVGLGGLGEWSAIPVPARAFLLKDCIPTRYKTGSDFDASSGQISIAELELQPHYVEEISLTAT